MTERKRRLRFVVVLTAAASLYASLLAYRLLPAQSDLLADIFKLSAIACVSTAYPSRFTRGNKPRRKIFAVNIIPRRIYSPAALRNRRVYSREIIIEPLENRALPQYACVSLAGFGRGLARDQKSSIAKFFRHNNPIAGGLRRLDYPSL